MLKKLLFALFLYPVFITAQINTERVMMIARNALYFEDYVLSIQYFNQVINAKPYLYEPYFFRGLAKVNLDDFQGAEEDCNKAIERNPFVVGVYQIRGLSRIRQNNYQGAVEDYTKALRYAPENLTLWHNLTLCHMQMKDYDAAQNDLSNILSIAPKYTRGYLMRGEVNLQQKDTLKALSDFNHAIELDKFDPDAWSARAMLYLQSQQYSDAETDLNQAIRLSIRNSGNYINRALARFHQNNLRGAMSDYDLAIEIDPNNFIGHYNRGLLRAQVGDDNRAIEDFNFVLMVEPDNMLATFNRGMLKAQTGDYKGAINDYTTVINQYPNFLIGYQYRSEARKKIGDRKGAEQDEFKLIQSQLDKINNTAPVDTTTSKDATAENNKTRKKSDKSISNYNKIVIADDIDNSKQYKNDYRGRVQDKNVNIALEPMFALNYYEKKSDVKKPLNFHAYVDELNNTGVFPKRLIITNIESPLTEEQIKYHFALTDTHTSDILADDRNVSKRFARAMDFYLLQDFNSAIDDLTAAILIDSNFYPAYFMRSLVRCKQLEYQNATEIRSNVNESDHKDSGAIDYDAVIADLNKVIAISPDFVYAYYNRGNLRAMLKDYRAALADYDQAIELNPNFADAYYNRGLTHIFLGNNKQGISDLSKAGELGLYSAYNIIKRFTDLVE